MGSIALKTELIKHWKCLSILKEMMICMWEIKEIGGNVSNRYIKKLCKWKKEQLLNQAKESYIRKRNTEQNVYDHTNESNVLI